MAETGWPLIPREVLPAPVPAARTAHRRGFPEAAESGRQLSFFGAGTIEPSPADLAGLLAGPGSLGRIGGTARISIVVDAAWRVHVLVKELVSRGLVVAWHPAKDQSEDTAHQLDRRSTGPDHLTGDTEHGMTEGDDHHGVAGDRPGAFEVRTAYSSRLNGLARSWPAAADRLFLSGPRLRLWVAAAGRPADGGYALGLDPAGDPAIIDAALVRAGLSGRVSDDGRHYLILGKKRLDRLAELVGDRPREAPVALWPGGAAA
jgi:hypothetical protein